MLFNFHKSNIHADYTQLFNLIKHINHEISTIWHADITYLKLNADTWVYLSLIYDEQTQKVISAIIDRDLVVRSLQKALIKAYNHPDYLHSDIGS